MIGVARDWDAPRKGLGKPRDREVRQALVQELPDLGGAVRGLDHIGHTVEPIPQPVGVPEEAKVQPEHPKKKAAAAKRGVRQKKLKKYHLSAMQAVRGGGWRRCRSGLRPTEGG